MSKGMLEVHAYVGPQAGTVAYGDLHSISSSMQRKTFYAKGLHWIFYYSNNKIFYSVSSNGVNWREPIFVTDSPSGYGDLFSVHFDGTYLHYVCAGALAYRQIRYRRGVPNGDGTITWSAEEQRIPELSEVYTPFPMITVDSEGYPWVGCYAEHGPQALQAIPTVCKSNQRDGTWVSNASGFPYYLNPQRTYTGVILVPLTFGKVYALYFRSFAKFMQPDLPTTPIYGKLWNGEKWSSEETVSTSHVANEAFNMISTIADGDDVHVVFLKHLTYEIVHIKRTLADWSPEQVVHTAKSKSSPVLAFSRSKRVPYCFWGEGNKIFYKKYVDLNWSELVEFMVEQDPITENQRITCSYEDYGSIIGVSWFLDSKNLIRYKNIIT